MLKRGHEVVVTRALPRVLTILLGVKPKLHVHEDGMDLEMLLRQISSKANSLPAAAALPVDVEKGGSIKRVPPSESPEDQFVPL